MAYKSSDNAAMKIAEVAENRKAFQAPLEIPVEAVRGNSTATIEAVLYFCNDTSQQVCLVDSLRIQLLLEVQDGAANTAKVEVLAKVKGR